MKIYTLILLGALVCTLLTPTSSFSQQLFDRVEIGGVDLTNDQERLLKLFQERDGTIGVELLRVRSPLTLSEGAATVRLALSNSESLTLLGQKTGENRNLVSWSAKSVDNSQRALFVVNESKLTGVVWNGHNVYKYEPLGDGLHALITVDGHITGECAMTSQNNRPGSIVPDTHTNHTVDTISPNHITESSTNSLSSTTTHIQVFTGYTYNAAQDVGDIQATIQLSIDLTNDTVGNHGSSVKFWNRDTNIIDYRHNSTDTECMGTYWDHRNRMVNHNDGYMDELKPYRDAVGADVAMMIIDQCAPGSKDGVAATIKSNASLAYALVNTVSTVDRFTYPHEVAHLFGADHDEPNLTNDPPLYSYGRAFSNGTKNIRTIVANNSDDCSGLSCETLPYFSDPNITYDGVAIGDASTMHNARILSERRGDVAAFRVDPPIDVQITGDANLECGVRGYWEALIDGGTGQYTATWYSRPVGGSTWLFEASYTNEPYFNEYYYEDTYIKVDVESTNGPRASSETYYVTTYGSSCNFKIVEKEPRPVLEFVLHQVYPNPFNPTTNITFSVPERGHVSIAIYDMQGREIEALLDRPMASGSYNIAWDASERPSGTYVVKMSSGTFSETRIVSVVK